MKKIQIIVFVLLVAFPLLSQEINPKYILSRSESYFVQILNEYRESQRLSPLHMDKRFYQRSYDQSYYIAKYNIIKISAGAGTIFTSHEQPYDIPNWDEDTERYYREDPNWGGENVACTAFLYGSKITSQEAIAKKILENWKRSQSHNELLLDPSIRSISICFLRMEIRKRGYQYVVSATMNVGK